MKFQVLGHEQICGRVPKMQKGPWVAELREKRIFVSDIGQIEGEIELLIGSDYYAQWMTGNKLILKNGLVALETQFGWTLYGKLDINFEEELTSNVSMQVSSMFISEASLTQLWDFETIAINDPVDKKSKSEREAEVSNIFCMRWPGTEVDVILCRCPGLKLKMRRQSNCREIAERRLQSTTNKLLLLDKYQEYDKIFCDWLAEDIIEVVDVDEKTNSYYLPHRAVFKPDSRTTPVRPVFDASCKSVPVGSVVITE